MSHTDTKSLALSGAQLAAGGLCELRFTLVNPFDDATLYVKLAPQSPWLMAVPGEAALAAGEKQAILVLADATKAKASALAGGVPSGTLQLALQRLAPGEPPGETLTEALTVRLPVASCPSCERILDSDLSDGVQLPELCPHCFERLRTCPECGAANTWLARTCIADNRHAVRESLDWTTIGGDAGHAGFRAERRSQLARRWSYPSVPPTRREQALEWSAPVAAWGLVAAAAATADGDAHVYAFDAMTGAPLWEPYPLPDPVYPERGGVALGQGGRLFVGTVEGIVAGLDALRGTRIWESALPGKILGALTVAGETLLVPLGTESGGRLALLDPETGATKASVSLRGLPDVAPAATNSVGVVHDDSGDVTAVSLSDGGAVLWRVETGAGFDAAPVLQGESVFCAGADGVVRCLSLTDGGEVWRFAVTNAPLTGTPAVSESLLHLPAGDGLHLVSAATGRAVRRYGSLRPLRSAPVVLGGTILYGSTDGSIWGIPPGKNPEKLYETGTVGSQLIAAPAIADNALFIAATNGCLYALTLG